MIVQYANEGLYLLYSLLIVCVAYRKFSHQDMEGLSRALPWRTPWIRIRIVRADGHILTQMQKFQSKYLAMIRNCKHRISTIGRNRQINIHILNRKLKGFSSTLTTGYRKNSRESTQRRGTLEYNLNPTLMARLNMIRGHVPQPHFHHWPITLPSAGDVSDGCGLRWPPSESGPLNMVEPDKSYVWHL